MTLFPFLMASIRFGALVADVKGSIGGVVFQSNGSGAMVRTKTIPTNKRTALQIYQRSNMAVYSAKWRNLSAGDQQMWVDDASNHPYVNRLGETKRYSGFMWFMKTNMNLEQATALS